MPALLVIFLFWAQGAWASDIDAELKAWQASHRWKAIVDLAERRPAWFCPAFPSRCLLLARAQSSLKDFQGAYRSYKLLIKSEVSEAMRLSAIHEAIEHLPPHLASSLLSEASTFGPSSFRRKVWDIASAWRMKRAARLHARGEDQKAWRLLIKVVPWIKARRNVRGARLLAAVAQALGKEDAGIWLEKAVSWSKAPEDRIWFIQFLRSQGDLDRALVEARRLPEDHPKRRELLASILQQKASEAYEAGDYPKAVLLYEKASTFTPLPRSHRLLMAWAYYHLGHLEKAAHLFEDLYREAADEEAAKGLYLARERLSPKPKAIPKAQRLAWFWKGGIGAGGRSRLGDGPFRLKLLSFPYLSLGMERGDQGVFLELWRTEVESDPVTVDDLPFSSSPTSFAFTQRARGEEGMLGLRWRGFELALGRTLSGGVIDPTWEGKLSLEEDQWGISLERRPVKDSVLSYTGVRMDLDGISAKWGRVMRHEVKAFMHGRQGRWFGLGNVSFAWYEGQNVKDNRSIAFYGAWLRSFDAKGFEGDIGPRLLLMHYQHNQNHFTPGHGGYFSPQALVMAGVWMEGAREKKKDEIRGKLGIGYQWQFEDKAEAVPVAIGPFPFEDYPASRQGGIAFEAELSLVHRLIKGWMLGGVLRLREGPDYDETLAMAFIGRTFHFFAGASWLE